MRSELSEFSYGFAITAELRDLFYPRVIEPPIFPTLRQEARLGWYVKFPIVGRSLFLQFKVAEALTRASASEWRHYRTPYYRFPLHRISRSDQHNRLRSLALTEPFVFYVAPRFYRLEEFNECYGGATVVNASAWIPLLSLPAISDDLQHHITYQTGRDVRFSSPESEPISKAFDGEAWRAYLTDEFERQKREMTIEDFSILRARLLGVLERSNVEYIPKLLSPVAEGFRFQTLKDVAYLSRTFFGAEFLLIHDEQQ
jgi:hypothetical protein